MTTLQQLSAAATELLPCPFCGGDAYTIESGGKWFVGCSQCYCNVGEAYDRDAMPEHMFATEPEAVAAWNTRTGQLVEVQADDATVERVARAIRDVKGGVNYDYLDFCRDAATAAIAAMPSQAALQAEIDRLRMELQNIAETTDDEITSRQAFVALSKGPRP